MNEPAGARAGWETMAGATAAAAKGGVTMVVDMPLNSDPVTVRFSEHINAYIHEHIHGHIDDYTATKKTRTGHRPGCQGKAADRKDAARAGRRVGRASPRELPSASGAARHHPGRRARL